MVLITMEKFPEEQILRFRSVELDIPHPFPSLCFLLFFRLLPLDPAATPTPPPPPPPPSPIFSDPFPLVRSLCSRSAPLRSSFPSFFDLTNTPKTRRDQNLGRCYFLPAGTKTRRVPARTTSPRTLSVALPPPEMY